MKTIVFNGWAAGLETWSLCTFPHDWVFSYIEQMDGLPETVLADSDEVILVGFSMGGNMMMRLLPRFAAKIRGLVFVSTTPFMMEEPASGWKGFSSRRLAAFRLGTELLFKGDPSPIYAKANLERGLDCLRTHDERATLQALSVRGDLKSVPVHIFQSERDGIVRPHNADYLKRIFPQARVTMVPGNEHILPVKIPELIDAAVESMI